MTVKEEVPEVEYGTAVEYAAGTRGHEKADFKKIANKMAIVFVPPFNMGMHGQKMTSSGSWFNGISANNVMMCQYSLIGESASVSKLCREEIKDRPGQDSLSQLEDLIRNYLPDAMRFGGSMLPTSLWIIAHGTPGHVKIGEIYIPVLEFVSRIKTWAGGSLLHVHIEACSALKGVRAEEKKRFKDGVIKDVVITGYVEAVGTHGVDIAQAFGKKLMAALSITVERDEPKLNSVSLWGAVMRELETQVGKAQRGHAAGSSEQQTFTAFRVI